MCFDSRGGFLPEVYAALQSTISLPAFLELEEFATVIADRRLAWEAYCAKHRVLDQAFGLRTEGEG